MNFSKITSLTLISVCLIVLPKLAFLQETPPEEEYSEFEIQEMALILDSLEQTLDYQSGEIILGDQIATIVTPTNYKYLGPEQSEWVLTEAWGNPPSETLGMLFPENGTIFSDDTYAVNITFEDIGYVDDSDAQKMDYTEILEGLKDDALSSNEYRVENGYPKMEIVGWASNPYYDQENRKLHWAKELRFDDNDVSTLNYDVRILGRRGVLSLNFISGINNLPTIKSDLPQILPNINFNEGHAYRNFDPSMDKIAAIGIGGLITGKVLVKSGLLVLLAKFWKIIAIGAVAGLAGIKKFVSRKKVS